MVIMNSPGPKARLQSEKALYLKRGTPPKAAGAVTADSVGTLVLSVLESIDLFDGDSVTNGNPVRSTGRRPKFGFLTSSSAPCECTKGW